jgi:predicted cobalt transporter CbtA
LLSLVIGRFLFAVSGGACCGLGDQRAWAPAAGIHPGLPVAAALLLAQSVGTAAKLAGLVDVRSSRQLFPAWIVWGQATGALVAWITIAWFFWVRA